jgi:hypothetical protein
MRLRAINLPAETNSGAPSIAGVRHRARQVDWQARQQPACDDSLAGHLQGLDEVYSSASGLLAVNLNPTANAFAPAVRTVSADHSPAAVLDVPARSSRSPSRPSP